MVLPLSVLTVLQCAVVGPWKLLIFPGCLGGCSA